MCLHSSYHLAVVIVVGVATSGCGDDPVRPREPILGCPPACSVPDSIVVHVPTTIRLSEDSLLLDSIDGSERLEADLIDQHGHLMTDIWSTYRPSFAWTSVDTFIVRVSDTGEVSAMAPGVTDVAAEWDNAIAPWDTTVSPAICRVIVR